MRLLTIVLASILVVPTYAVTLKKIAAIDPPGPPGEHFDHLQMDYEDHFLLSAHVGVHR